ncbi:MAG: TonB-dependent receptor, partial [Pyrinomonadaceae bacterium]|nr:TonB-dependent receptor [Pyrinomonadaceae bacterium]
VDRNISDKFTVFGRYNYAPSQDDQRARFCAASCVARLAYKTKTLTFGATNIFTSKLVNDFRVNFSSSKVNQSYFLDEFGGAIVPPASSIYPSFTRGENGYFIVQVDADGDNTLSDGLFSDNIQNQFNIVDSISYNVGGHALKFGVDYRRLSPRSDGGSYKRVFNYTSALTTAPRDTRASGLNRLINNGAANVFSIIAPDVILQPRYDNFSLFAQDTWRINSRLTLTYGLRYELNPAPSEANGNEPVTVLPFDVAANATLAPRGTKFYETTYNNFAPRIGVSFQPFANGKTVVRGGFGVFYDLGYGFTGTAFSTGLFPYARNFSSSTITFGSPAADIQAQPNAASLRIPRLFGYAPDFKLPYTLQYNASIEQFFGNNDSVTVSYVGAKAERLGRVTSYRNVNSIINRLDYVTNDGKSDYNSLQAQYQRRLTKGLQSVVSYTFAKSLDNVSDESQNNFQAPTARLDPNLDRAPSSFDVRHAFNAAVSYEIPSPFESGLARKFLGGFGIDAIFRARTATPVNVLTGRDPLGLGFTTVVRPDLNQGVPIYIEDSTVAGGRRFNRAAFDAGFATGTNSQTRQGNLGRNALRGFGTSQLDLALRRRFGITENVNIQLRLDAFNVFNRANFANPSGVLTSGNFGVATQTLNRNLGGLGAIYQVGGPRSFQIAAKLNF